MDRKTDKRTSIKQYAPNLSMQGHKNVDIYSTLLCCVPGHEVECWPINHKVPSVMPRYGCQLWGCSLAQTFGVSIGVVPTLFSFLLSLSQMKNFRHFETERACRQQFRI